VSAQGRKSIRPPGILTVLPLLLLLAGCSDSGVSDLRAFVEEAKQKQGRVAPLPEFKPVETFAYSAHTLKDPFRGWSSDTGNAVAERNDSGIRPDVSRNREVLEGYPLDTLRMMGALEFQGVRWGLVRAPDGIVYRVRQGNYMGQNYGKVQAVSDNKLMLTEIVPDGLGGWEERNASLAISEQ
jgi:type IV pilus assembly protein PilP